ncbi:MAG: hypothetical protein A3H97_04900 [Acidobacteria bacterium RIFCSPLOWO2_02_FULL_65_29]|nr:MAG: hypothetical protein A3H97_04900 [Acidobacteria bacterium RIFCSPLOWO2_02_FULL_65_29]
MNGITSRVNESKAERVAANGRPLGRGGVTRDMCLSPSTRVGCSRTGPERDSCFRLGCGEGGETNTAVRLKPDTTISMTRDAACDHFWRGDTANRQRLHH